MPEVYKCICGNDTWIIFNGYMKCSKCMKEYNLEDIIFTDPARFNQEREYEKENLKAKRLRKK